MTTQISVTHRVIERWPVSTYRVGRKALHSREELDQLAEGMIQASLVKAA